MTIIYRQEACGCVATPIGGEMGVAFCPLHAKATEIAHLLSDALLLYAEHPFAQDWNGWFEQVRGLLREIKSSSCLSP